MLSVASHQVRLQILALHGRRRYEKKEDQEILAPEEWRGGEVLEFSLWGFIYSRLGTIPDACCVIFST